MSEWWARLRALYGDLSDRERILVAGAGALLGVLLVYAAVVAPLLSSIDRGTQRALTAEQEVAEMQRLRVEYDRIQSRLAGVERQIQQGPKGNIFTTLETLARQSAVKVDSMEPQAASSSERYRETKVQVVLKGVTLTQMVAYLDGIESAPQRLSVKSLRIRTRADKPELLDVTFTVSTFEPA